MTSPRCSLLIPVKDGRAAKTRLGADDDGRRARLMAAFARDAITAAAASTLARVHVVGDAAGLADVLAGLDVTVLPDEGEGDLNRALARAAARVAGPASAVGVLLADLPCLRTEELDTALAEATRRSFVPDYSGSGTTMLVAPPGVELDPRFGVDSALRHADSGAFPIGVRMQTLRLDVDTTSDLDLAVALGVGASTAALLEELT